VSRRKAAQIVRLRIKRVYEAPAKEDGTRVLVDRLWPRGIAKAKAKIDLWLRDVAPSNALRQRLHAEPDREALWDEFRLAYARELEREPARSAAQSLLQRIKSETVTLVYAARTQDRNNAVALKAWLEARLAG
jgi:uncharacterized protein YeaO (DUF488 family)